MKRHSDGDLERGRLVEELRAEVDSRLSIEEIADALYAVRCDVAHEGRYRSVFFSDDGVSRGSGGWPLWVSLSVDSMYEIVVAGCVLAARHRLGEDTEVPEQVAQAGKASRRRDTATPGGRPPQSPGGRLVSRRPVESRRHTKAQRARPRRKLLAGKHVRPLFSAVPR